MLRTFSHLRIDGAAFRREKPLLLAVYLSIEGKQSRSSVAQLFWPKAKNPRDSLSKALTQLRKNLPNVIEADSKFVWCDLICDVNQFLSSVKQDDLDTAIKLYTAPFINSLGEIHAGAQLEEWLIATREYLAEQMQQVLLSKAEASSPAQRLRFTERAYLLEAAPPPSPAMLSQIHQLLAGGPSLLLPQLEAEAREFGLDLNLVGSVQPHKTGEPPNYLSSFVGRAKEIGDIISLLQADQTRLTTILGQGGIGKSRLAAEVARRTSVKEAFPAGVYFVECENVTSLGSLMQTVGDVFKLSPSTFSEIAGFLERQLRNGRYLIVLDNVESFEAWSAAISVLLLQTHDLTILTTSRQALNITGEVIYRLDGLSHKSVKSDHLPDAQRLFISRALEVQPTIQTKPQDLEDITSICLSVGGSPLAVELAAAWTDVLPLHDIKKGVKRDLALLEQEEFTDDERRLSIEKVFDQMWSRLSVRQKMFACRLTVFQGTFSHQSVQVIAELGLSDLRTLTRRAIVSISSDGRFDLHPLMRTYLSIQAGDDLKGVRERHSSYFLKRLTQVWKGKLSQADRYTTIKAEFDDIVTAWRWALANNPSGTDMTTLHLRRYFNYSGHLMYGRELFREAVSRLNPHSDTVVQLRVRNAFAWLCYLSGHVEEGLSVLRYSESLMEDNTFNYPDEHQHFNTYGAIAWASGEYDLARKHWEKALKLTKEEDDVKAEANSSGNLGLLEMSLGNYVQSEYYLSRTVDINRREKEQLSLITNLSHLASLLNCTERPDEAMRFLDEAEALSESLNFQGEVPYLLSHRVKALTLLEKYEKALDITTKALQVAEEQGLASVQAIVEADMAFIYLELNECTAAWNAAKNALDKAINSEDVAAISRALLAFSGTAIRCGEPDKAKTVLDYLAVRNDIEAIDKAKGELYLNSLGGLPPVKTILPNTPLLDVARRIQKWTSTI